MLKQMQAQARAVPGWLSGLLITTVFVLPIVWVMGDDTLFDLILTALSDQFGPEADFRHLLAYLLCVLILLVPAGVLIQLIGRWRLRASARE